jgi:hypothetical protein
LKKDHAIHNESACLLLHSTGKFPDWVVTTAFYSGLHFVQHEIFPVTINSTLYSSFENYYNGHYSNYKNKPSKHRATINLVFNHLGNDAGELYEWLHDVRTARYRNFKTNPQIAQQAKDYLDELKTYILK